MTTSKDKEKGFKYHRRCKLPSCDLPFSTNREWQFFHDPECQKEWHLLLRKSKEALVIEVELLKTKMKEIEKKLGMK